MDAAVLVCGVGDGNGAGVAGRGDARDCRGHGPHASPALLFVAIVAVPIVGYGSRYLVPASESIEDMREIAAAATLVCGVALVMVRLLVERRAVEQADERVRLLAAACEQAGELILITGRTLRGRIASNTPTTRSASRPDTRARSSAR